MISRSAAAAPSCICFPPARTCMWCGWYSVPRASVSGKPAPAPRFFSSRPGSKDVIVKKFRDGFFPYQGTDIKEFFEELKKDVAPDLIFTHYRDDRHQDHRTISDLTWNTWRRHLILEYEIPKYDGDLGTPNCFVPLGKDVCARKIKTICDVFKTESNKAWMTEDTFQAILRLRGVECAAPDKYAEAFYCRKFALGT